MNPSLPVLVIDDDPQIRAFVGLVLRHEGWDVSEAGSAKQVVEMLHDKEWSAVLCDALLAEQDGFTVLRRLKEEMPATKVVLMTGQGTTSGAPEVTSFEAFEYLVKPFSVDELESLSQALLKELSSRGEIPLVAADGANGYLSVALLGCSKAIVQVREQVGRLATTNLPVLLMGESGSGKGAVATALHTHSNRADQPFVSVHCGAIPAQLMEAELFGQVEASFAGADRDRRGSWKEADRGTIFLDEITETSPTFQVKLLRALEQGEIRRLGSKQTESVDVRFITATSRNLEPEVDAGRFRLDLFYLLNAVSITLPPLRERREDISLLAKIFIERVRCSGSKVALSAEARDLMKQYPWPGNIRELENAVRRAATMCEGTIRVPDLPERLRKYQKRKAWEPSLPAETSDLAAENWALLSTVEGCYVEKVLAHTQGNKQAAARLLGVDRKTLHRMIKRHNISLGDVTKFPFRAA
jgi:DNA-binding NtrC family response regulator